MKQYIQETEADLEQTLAIIEEVRASIGTEDDPLQMELIEEAANWLKSHVKQTPLIYSEQFSQDFGFQVYLKPENLQKTGAYKIRGASWRIAHLSEEEKRHPLMTASAGNHAQGVARAARDMGLKAIVAMPETTPLVKVNRTKSYGAEVVLHGESFDEAFEYAVEVSREKNYTFIHPFDDLIVAQGQGSVGVEIMEEIPDADLVLVPIGGGGLGAGVAAYIKQKHPATKVYGIEPARANSAELALAQGHPATLRRVDTIADGVAVARTGNHVFPYLAKYLDGIITVRDEELVGSFLDMMESHKMIVENAGLLSVAALKHLHNYPELALKQDSKVCCILSGGNMDVITVASLVQHGLIARNRIFTFAVLLPDRPGELERVAHVVAENRGNIIHLDHNQFVSINRNSAVQLQVTLEAFGPEHKQEILDALKRAGYEPFIVNSSCVY